MTGLQPSLTSILIAASVILAGTLVYVGYRERNPEWRKYRERGIELGLKRLAAEVAAEAESGKKEALTAELHALRDRKPQIIEIKPFGGQSPHERCLTCHFGIEDLSASHPNSVFGCVVCHGGNPADLTVKGAHMGLRGGRNPAALDIASSSCGGGHAGTAACHSGRDHPLLNRADNVPLSIMATNAGIIGILRFQWGLDEDSSAKFGVRSVSDGRTSLRNIPPERTPQGSLNLCESHFRKFCASCHLWGHRYEDIGRLEGCAACHAAYPSDGRYKGGDPTINRDEPGHSATHTITNRIPDDRCRACHHRSARVGLNYHGEMESSQYGTPFVRGGLSDKRLEDGRFVLSLTPDIHYEKGMGCVDCHTGQDTMGDGTIYRKMKDQVEIRCEDCHGGYSAPPRTTTVGAHDPLVRALIRTSGLPAPAEGDTVLLTSKGRPLPHIRLTDKGFRLIGKLTGKEHPVSVVTGKKNGHTIKGHERLECDTCHSAWSPQCYGCHQVLDLANKGLDHISGETTDGRWAEGRSFFRFERNIYGINGRGRVGILVPGCQVRNTVIDKSGKVVKPYDSLIMALKNGATSIAAAPTHPHTTRREVPRCVDCHLDSKAIGLGEGQLNLSPGKGEIEASSTYDSSGSGLKISFTPEAMVDTAGRVVQGTSHSLARGFNLEEIRRIVAIGPCLACHDKYDDPAWERSGPYIETPACKKALETTERSRPYP